MEDSQKFVSSPDSDLRVNYGSIEPDNNPSKEFEVLIPPPPLRPVLIKTQSSFWQDLCEFRSGSLPHSMILAVSIGFLCGVAAFLYYWILEFMLEFVWKSLPETLMANVDGKYHILWIPIVGFGFAFLLGCTVKFMGDVSVQEMPQQLTFHWQSLIHMRISLSAGRLTVHNTMCSRKGLCIDGSCLADGCRFSV